MVRPDRFELPTFWFVARRSIQLSYGRDISRVYRKERGEPPRNLDYHTSLVPSSTGVGLNLPSSRSIMLVEGGSPEPVPGMDARVLAKTGRSALTTFNHPQATFAAPHAAVPQMR
jgi:hypothetical protein